jgi:hypothetical protein
MVEEGLLGRLVCLSWSHDSRLRNLIGITLKAIYDRYDVRHCRSAPPLMRRRLTFSLASFDDGSAGHHRQVDIDRAHARADRHPHHSGTPAAFALWCALE